MARDPLNYAPWIDCWQCGGIGMTAGCFEDTCSGADCDPEDAEYCCNPHRCDVCKGAAGWHEKPETHSSGE